jgi:hypothetical protein
MPLDLIFGDLPLPWQQALDRPIPERISLLRSPEFLLELHHFLWMQPFYNPRSKQRDEGLSCRDHAVISVSLMAMLNVESFVVHGHMMMVTGPNLAAEPRALEFRPHSWAGCSPVKLIDLSIRAPKIFSEWGDWRSAAALLAITPSDRPPPLRFTYAPWTVNIRDLSRSRPIRIQSISLSTSPTDQN